jgi:hypothetical protein
MNGRSDYLGTFCNLFDLPAAVERTSSAVGAVDGLIDVLHRPVRIERVFAGDPI